MTDLSPVYTKCRTPSPHAVGFPIRPLTQAARAHFEAILHRFQNDGEQSLKTMVKDATKKLKALAAA
jgi:hypothetical protein